MSIERRSFGTLPDGRPVESFTLRNRRGLSITAINYGGRITQIQAPDRGGRLADIALGFDNLEQYLNDQLYFGPIVGRYALRIAGGKFTLNGIQYQLPTNEGHNTLHGGPGGFDKRLWTADTSADELRLSYFSPHLEEGFPADVMVAVIYRLTDDNEFHIDYSARADQPTPLSFTNHIYLNLAGAGSSSVLDHQVMIPADQFLPTDDQALPTGEILTVHRTELDFTRPHPIGQRIGQGRANQQGGYDHFYVLTMRPDGLQHAARVQHPANGRCLDLFTDWPGFEFYTSNKLDGSIRGIGGSYPRYCAFTLEPMWYPDAMHHPNFPSAVLQPGETLRRRIIYRFRIGEITSDVK
jgi:aldose 1-epimerase